MNQLKIDMTPVTLINADECLNKDVQKLMATKNQKLVSHLEPLTVEADSRLLKQVMLRLIHNAAKFGIEGSDIFVESLKNGNNLRFVVHNKGPQIPPNVIDKIMKPFFIDEDVMHHATGMGLGLTICQSILKSHNSMLQFKNTDHGVMVYFEVALASN
ncbi:Heme sensor protein HssS [compost metagenome]